MVVNTSKLLIPLRPFDEPCAIQCVSASDIGHPVTAFLRVKVIRIYDGSTPKSFSFKNSYKMQFSSSFAPRVMIIL